MADRTFLASHVTPQQIVELDAVPGPCVTVLAPTDGNNGGRAALRIRIRNAIVQAESELIAFGARASMVKAMLAPAHDIEGDDAPLDSSIKGIAIYLAPGFSMSFALRNTPTASVALSDDFMVKPLLSILSSPSFYVLALDQSRTRLLCIHDETTTVIELDDLPVNIEEIVGNEEATKHRQMHSAGKRGRTPVSVSHGSGDRGVLPKDRMLRFCQAVDRAIGRHLSSTHAALVLAADQPIRDIFRNASHYPDLMPTTIDGCPTDRSDEDLAKEARRIVAEETEASRQSIAANFGKMESMFMASDRLDDVIQASAAGRVQTLLLSDRENGDDLRLVNRVILDTLSKGGRALELPDEMMPSPSAIAALFRY